ncbi:MAG: hypothetical protein ACO1TE_06410 [Prosthecobacter sp.]
MLTTKFATLDLPATFGSLAGSPADNTALAAALTTKLNKAGDTVTGALTSTANGADSTPALHLTGTLHTGGTATTTKPQLLIEPAGTSSDHWHPSGTLLGVNAPEGFGGEHLCLQTNGMPCFKVAAHATTLGNSTNGATLIMRGTGTDLTIATGYGDSLSVNGHFLCGGVALVGSSLFGRNAAASVYMPAAGQIGFGNSTDNSGSNDTYLSRDSAGVLAQRNGSNPQGAHLYNSHASSTSFERGAWMWAGDILRFGTQKGSAGGSARTLALMTDDTNRLEISATGALDFKSLSLTEETFAADRAFQIDINGVTVKVPCSIA